MYRCRSRGAGSLGTARATQNAPSVSLPFPGPGSSPGQGQGRAVPEAQVALQHTSPLLGQGGSRRRCSISFPWGWRS